MSPGHDGPRSTEMVVAGQIASVWPDGSRWELAESSGGSAGTRLVWRGASSPGGPGQTIVVPERLTPEAAMLLPVAAEALRAWDSLHLELGVGALITYERPWSPVLAAVARWYGALPIVLGQQANADLHIDAGAADAVAGLARRLAPHASVAVIELTGRADVVDLLLEGLPRYARVLFAGLRHEPLTIDYYMNVHRKGLHLVSTTLSPVRAFDSAMPPEVIRRASQLLQNPERAKQLASSLVEALPSQGSAT